MNRVCCVVFPLPKHIVLWQIHLNLKMKKLKSLSSIATRSTHPSSLTIPFKPAMDSLGVNDILIYCNSSCYNISSSMTAFNIIIYFSFFSCFLMVSSESALDQAVEFSVLYSHMFLQRSAGEICWHIPAPPFPELWGKKNQIILQDLANLEIKIITNYRQNFEIVYSRKVVLWEESRPFCKIITSMGTLTRIGLYSLTVKGMKMALE